MNLVQNEKNYEVSNIEEMVLIIDKLSKEQDRNVLLTLLMKTKPGNSRRILVWSNDFFKIAFFTCKHGDLFSEVKINFAKDELESEVKVIKKLQLKTQVLLSNFLGRNILVDNSNGNI